MGSYILQRLFFSILNWWVLFFLIIVLLIFIYIFDIKCCSTSFQQHFQLFLQHWQYGIINAYFLNRFSVKLNISFKSIPSFKTRWLSSLGCCIAVNSSVMIYSFVSLLIITLGFFVLSVHEDLYLLFVDTNHKVGKYGKWMSVMM